MTVWRGLIFCYASPAIREAREIPEVPMTANCPECDATITLGAKTVEGEIIACPDCGAELEVVNINPPTLVLAPEVEEDWGE